MYAKSKINPLQWNKSIIKLNINFIDDKTKKKEKIAMRRTGYLHLFEEMEEAIQPYHFQNHGQLFLVEARTQADTTIVFEGTKEKSSGALSADGDFLMMGGKKYFTT